MLIKTCALFTTTLNTSDPDDVINELINEVVEQINTNPDTGEQEKTMLYPTRFVFDMKQVIAINKSCHAGYSTIRYTSESYTVKISFEKLERLFFLCKG